MLPKFSDWLKLREVGTGSNCVAVFARPIGGMVTRNYPRWADEDEPKKKSDVSEKIKNTILRILSSRMDERS